MCLSVCELMAELSLGSQYCALYTVPGFIPRERVGLSGSLFQMSGVTWLPVICLASFTRVC